MSDSYQQVSPLRSICASLSISIETSRLLYDVSIENPGIFVNLIQNADRKDVVTNIMEQLRDMIIARTRDNRYRHTVLEDWKKIYACVVSEPEFARRLGIRYLFESE